MSDKPAKEGKDKKGGGGGKMGLILVAVGMLVVGGGGVFGLVAAGVIGGSHAEEKQETGPKLIRKGEEDPYAVAGEGEKEGEGAGMEVDGDGGDEFRTAYYTFTQEFTSNLKDSDALVQMALACSTRRDGRVLLWLKRHELAIRSRMLAVLADTDENDLYTIEGKEKLQKRLTGVINKTLEEKEGYGGVDAVYFRSLIIQ